MIRWQKLFSQSAAIFAARMAGAGIMFLVQAAIARSFGQKQFGDFLLILAATNIVAMLLPLGFQTVGSYFVAEYAVRHQRTSVIRFVRQGLLQVVVMFVLLFAAAPIIVRLLGPAGNMLGGNWSLIMSMALASALVFLSGSTLVALKRPFLGLAAETLFRPLVIAISFAAVMVLQTSDGQINRLMTFMTAGYMAIAILHGLVAVQAIRTVGDVKPHPSGEFKRWWRFAFPWVAISLATDFFFDIDLLHLSYLFDATDLAVFGLAVRIFTLAAFGITAVYTIILPHVFEAEASQNRSLFMKRIYDANLAALGMSFALMLALALAGPFVMRLFGPDFVRGSFALVILSAALFVRSFFGPASLMLSLHDRPYAPLPAAACGLALMFGFNQLVVPLYGITGAAAAALAAITLWSILLWLTAWRITGVDVSMLPRLWALFKR